MTDSNECDKYDFTRVARWSKNVPGGNIFNLRYLLFPINIRDTHWTLAVVFMEHKCIQYYYDSLPDDNEFHNNLRNGVMQYLKDEYKALKLVAMS